MTHSHLWQVQPWQSKPLFDTEIKISNCDLLMSCLKQNSVIRNIELSVPDYPKHALVVEFASGMDQWSCWRHQDKLVDHSPVDDKSEPFPETACHSKCLFQFCRIPYSQPSDYFLRWVLSTPEMWSSQERRCRTNGLCCVFQSYGPLDHKQHMCCTTCYFLLVLELIQPRCKSAVF